MTSSPHHPKARARFFTHLLKKTVLTPPGIALLGLARLFYHPPADSWAEVTTLDLPLRGLGAEFDGLRLVQISDFHFGTWVNARRLAQVVDWVNSLDPDLIAITGDYVTHEPAKYRPFMQPELARLRSRLGIYTVLGNHDHWSDPRPLRAMLAACGICELDNRVHTLRRGRSRLHIAGVDDIMVENDRLEVVLRQIPAGEAAILLAHEPDYADVSAATNRFGLQLSGHSHGGQLQIPVLGPPFLPALGRKYVSGLYQVNGMHQYTNRGIGTSELQLRINCPPEITLIHLRSENGRSPDLESL